jgi:hypothetical protein
MRYLIAALLLSITVASYAQNSDTLATKEKKVDIYSNFTGETIFSLADVEYRGSQVDPILRFTIFLHLFQEWHFDFGKNFGLTAGMAVRNVGFITRDDPIRIQEHLEVIQMPDYDEIDIKRRSYSFGIPIGFKVGTVKDGRFVFAGVEPELMFNYKEKLFVNGDKDDKYNEWFSDRVNLINPSVFAGFQFKNGINIRAKYYLLDFLDTDYEEQLDNGQVNRPYEGLSTRLFYISISTGFTTRRNRPGFNNIPEDRT